MPPGGLQAPPAASSTASAPRGADPGLGLSPGPENPPLRHVCPVPCALCLGGGGGGGGRNEEGAAIVSRTYSCTQAELPNSSQTRRALGGRRAVTLLSSGIPLGAKVTGGRGTSPREAGGTLEDGWCAQDSGRGGVRRRGEPARLGAGPEQRLRRGDGSPAVSEQGPWEVYTEISCRGP